MVVRLPEEETSRAWDKPRKKRNNMKKAGAALEKTPSAVAVDSAPAVTPDWQNISGTASTKPVSGQSLLHWDMAVDIEVIAQTNNQNQEVELANAGWPWVGAPSKLLLQAPYAVNQYNLKIGFFKKPEATQNSKLFDLHRGMDHPILSLLFENHSCASKFAATCQTAFSLVALYIDHWDITRGEFNLCERDPMAKGKDVPTGSVGKIVVVTPFRTQKWRGENYKCEMHSLQNMTLAFSNFAERFEILHLHRIPLLTTHLLALVIPHMRKLKVLGIYRCELIHVGDTMRLLEILRTDRGSGKTKDIALDFYPRFHVGPADNSTGNDYYTGTYGVTWDNFGLDSRLAIWQLMSRILPQAKKQGVDIVGKDSAFRLWLDKTPCWRVDETIKALEEERDTLKLSAQVDYPHTRGSQHRLSHGGKWCVAKIVCRDCNTDVPGVFYDFEEYTQYAWFASGNSNTYSPLCLGCKLTRHLNYETDHNKIYKLDMVKRWLGNPDGSFNVDNLQKALHEKPRRKGMVSAHIYDMERRKVAAKNQGMEEKQVPLKKGWPCSPTIDRKEPKCSFW